MEKRKTSILPNGFGKMWLGNLVYKLGGDWEKLRCRGEITDFSLDGNVLTMCFIHSTSSMSAIMTNQIGKKAFYWLSSLFSPYKT